MEAREALMARQPEAPAGPTLEESKAAAQIGTPTVAVLPREDV